jgi:glucokinase
MGLYLVGCEMPLASVTYRNSEFIQEQKEGIFEQTIIAPFLQHCWGTIPNIAPIELSEIVACLAIAGPVKDNKVQMSNLLDIEIDGTAIANHTHCPTDRYVASIKVCKIINDFVAQGYGCLTLQEHEVWELIPGSFKKVNPSGPKACVGAGTGLGECYLSPDEHGVYSCFPSEGGHVEWAPKTDTDVNLWRYLKAKFDHKTRISVERVVSGTGLANCFEFFAKEYPAKVNQDVKKEFEEAGDMKGKVVAESTKKCEVAKMAMETMITYVW